MPFNLIIKILIKDVRLLFFSLALLLYALWGSPTPNQPGIIELAIGTLLVLSLTFTGAFQEIVTRLMHRTDKWFLSVLSLFIYGFTVTLIVAVTSDASASLILRDIVAFFFLCAPLFFYSFLKVNEKRKKILAICLLCIGIIFSLRVLLPNLSIFITSTELLYLANSPLVLFSSLFLISRSVQYLYEGLNLKNILVFLMGLILFLITLSAMLVDTQRATVAALIVSAIFLSGLMVIKAPLKSIVPIIILSILVISSYSFIQGIIENVGLKTANVGLNMRLQELQAVWGNISSSWISVAFGQGWGASFASPAVGELQVTFTHSLLTYILFKMGVIGLFLTLIYLFFVFEKLVRLYFIDPVKGNAMLWPLLIPVFLYASHKSFDFGLLLTVILVSSDAARQKLRLSTQ